VTNNNNNNSIPFYLRAELNTHWPVTVNTNTNNSNMTVQDETKKKQQRKQQKQRKMHRFKLLTLKQERLKISVSLHTAFAVETHLDVGQWLEAQVNTCMLKLQMFRVGTRRSTISWTEGEYFFTMALPAHSGPWPLIKFRNNFYRR
jgi:hypothetical protein